MRLCFGIFAKILSYCKQGLTQNKFVPRIAWVVDRRNSCLASKLDFDVDDPDDIEGNPPVVSRLLSCERPFELRDGHFPSVEIARERFNAKVMPVLLPDKVKKAVLAILYIIYEDMTLESENIEIFRKCFGMHKDELLLQSTLDVPDFLTRVLLYTTYTDNEDGLLYTKEITDDFIEKVADDSRVWVELNDDMQTVKIRREEEMHLWTEVKRIAEMRLCLMQSDENFRSSPIDPIDIMFLYGDAETLFPNMYRRIERIDPRTKEMMRAKMKDYSKLLHEFAECLRAMTRSMANQTTEWPIFPDAKALDVRQRLTNVCNELSAISLSPEPSEEVSPEVE